MQVVEWLLRCSTCGIVYASVAVPEGQQTTWESPVAIRGCHPTSSGGPGFEAVLKKDTEPFQKVCRMLSDEKEPVVHTSICFTFLDGKREWFFSGES